MAVTTDKTVIPLGDRRNKKQSVVMIPAQAAANKPGILNLQDADDSGVVGDHYEWFDHLNRKRYHTSIPTNQDSDGEVFVGRATTDTLTGKTLTAPTITTPVITAPTTTTGIGAAAGTGVVATEGGVGVVHKTTLTLTATPVVLVDEAGVVAYGGLKIYDFPAGAIMTVGATVDLVTTLSSAGVDATWEGDFGLGTVACDNDATLTSTEDDILPTTAIAVSTASVGAITGQSTAAENVVFDGTGTAKDLILNILVDDADHDVTSTPCNILCAGTVTFHWINLGDY